MRAYAGAEDVFEAGATFELFGPRDEGVGFMDLYWPGVTIIEMKAPRESGRVNHDDEGSAVVHHLTGLDPGFKPARRLPVEIRCTARGFNHSRCALCTPVRWSLQTK